MGLLDAIFSNPAATAALGQGLLAGNLGAGTAGFFGAIEAQKEKALKSRLLESQIQENAAQAAFRQAEAQKQLAAITEQQRINQVLQNAGKPKPGNGPTNLINDALGGFGIGAQPALLSQGINYQELIRQGVPVERVKALAEARNYGRDEIARTIDTVDAQGRPVTRQYTKFGDPVGGDALQWKAPLTINQGDRTTLFDQVSMRPVTSLQTNQSPDSKASNALGWANNALARQRLAMEQSAPKGQYDPERGVLVDPRTGIASPVMMGGQPIGPKEKELTDAQAKANLFGRRMAESEKVFSELAAKGVNTPSVVKQAMENVPLVGGMFGAAANMSPLVSVNEQRLEQAQRDYINAVLRRESGAVISPAEFDNARKQYFPQIGDSPEVIEQKRRNRETAIAGLMAEVPQRFKQDLSAVPGKKSAISNGGWSATEVK